MYPILTVDVSKNKVKKVEPFTGLQPGLESEPGLNFYSTCENRNCRLYKCEIIAPIGAGEWDLHEILENVECPVCKTIVKPSNFLFTDCFFEIKYRKMENNRILQEESVTGYGYFENSNEGGIGISYTYFDKELCGEALFKKIKINCYQE